MGRRSVTITTMHEDAIRVVPIHGYSDLAEVANAAPAQPPPTTFTVRSETFAPRRRERSRAT
jgi:hypothetical protein